ncbi:MAG TPA: sensor domain-containing protein [Devosia sp.]|nr:sensor domain-containing protein [Devosia sp.]
MNQNTQSRALSVAQAVGSAFRSLFDRERWALVPRQSLFLLTALPLALTVPVVMICLVSIGAGLTILGVGIILLLLAAFLARWFGALEIRRLTWAGASPIEPPIWPDLAGQTLPQRLRLVLFDGHQWSYIVYGGLYLALGTVTGSVALVWITSIFNGATRWLWNDWAVTSPEELAQAGIWWPTLWSPPLFLHGPLTILAYTVLGAAALVGLPWLTRNMVALHDRIARVFLGRYSPEEIEAQMAGLRRSRQSGMAAEGRTLRKLERDLHDGPQQQLLRLQLDLASAQRKLASDPEGAARLVEEAALPSAQTLGELRSLVRGLAPPILQDRGLAAALAALAERNAIATTISTALDPTMEIQAAVQQGIYFVVAELLANTTKHSSASNVAIVCRTDPAEQAVVVTLVDDGQGGAKMLPGHGLSGIAERVEGLGGQISITSPTAVPPPQPCAFQPVFPENRGLKLPGTATSTSGCWMAELRTSPERGVGAPRPASDVGRRSIERRTPNHPRSDGHTPLRICIIPDRMGILR